MGLKQIILPQITALITSEKRLQKKRLLREKKRQRKRMPHQVTFYHRINDPYSHLLLKVLPDFRDRFGLAVEPVVLLLDMKEAYYPAPDMLERLALKDACDLADRYDIPFPRVDTPPAQQKSLLASRLLLSMAESTDPLETMIRVGDAFWREGDDALQKLAASQPLLPEDRALDQLRLNQQRLEKKGHYLSGMLHYGGEWYWGLDRLGHLERRLLDLGLSADDQTLRYSHPVNAFPTLPVEQKAPPGIALDFFFSFRSPYSYLAIERACKLADCYGVNLTIKPVLPMVMRGMKVPSAKRMYIVHDAKREAVQAGIPFGRIFDPVGPGTERAFSLFRHAREKGKERAYILSVARGAWSEGIDLSTDTGLKRCVERIGLDWQACRRQLRDESWREMAESNRREMFALGSWGVPTFRLGETVVWGQDRFWVLEDRLRRMAHD
ncbi:MAG: DsbA family protein [bacterium]